MRKWFILAVLAVLAVVAYFGFFNFTYYGSMYRGRIAAERDIANDKLQIKSRGYVPIERDSFYRQVLEDKYGIAIEDVRGTGKSGALAGYVDGYNSLMQQEFDRRFGKSAISDLQQEVGVIIKSR